MSSFRQIEANRGNALKITGPKNGRWQTAVAAKCGSAWTDRRNYHFSSQRHRRLRSIRGGYHARLRRPKFLPWRLSDDGPGASQTVAISRISMGPVAHTDALPS